MDAWMMLYESATQRQTESSLVFAEVLFIALSSGIRPWMDGTIRREAIGKTEINK